MTNPFLYLFVCSVKNRVLARLRRLREPRYLIGAIIGVAYLYFVFVPSRRRRSRQGTMRVTLTEGPLASLQWVGAFVLWASVFVRWIVPVSRQPIECTPAETQLLLTAPVSRRRVVRYKLLRSLAGIFLSVAILFVLGWSAVSWSFLVGLFLLFTGARLHLLGVALTRDTLARGKRPDAAAFVALLVAAAGAVAAVRVIAPGVALLARGGDWAPVITQVRTTAATPMVSWSMAPFSLMIRPLFADWPWGLLAAVWPALGLVLLNYAWVFHAEAAHARTVDVVERDAAAASRMVRPVRRPSPFELAPQGRPEWAIVWKNLLMIGRFITARTLLRVVLPVGLALLFALTATVTSGDGRQHGSGVVMRIAAIAWILSGFLALIGPYMARNDLRQDLPKLSLMKTWPISGAALLRGQVLTPSLLLSSVIWVLLSVATLVGIASRQVPMAIGGPLTFLAIGASGAVLLPALIVAQVTIQNAAVVVFPGWMPTGPTQPRGVEAMGQQMLVMGLSMLLLVFGLLPGAVLATPIVLLGWPLAGWLAVVPAAWIVAALLLAEAYVALHALGRLLTATDPPSDGLTGN